MRKLVCLAVSLLLLTGCKTLYHGGVGISNASKAGKTVKVVAQNTLILGFGYDDNLLFEARSQLLKKCKSGATAISVVSEIDPSFIIADQLVTVEGVCI